jgi:hypothetical protein
MRHALLAALALLLPTAAVAQTPAPAQPRLQAQLAELPPILRLGARVETLRQAWPVAPIVVLAPDAPTALDAMALWTPARRFPVLIDDGSARAREDIARFVRAFAPDRVIAIPAPDARVALAPSSLVAQAYARVWGASGPDEIPARWGDTSGVAPPGVVVAGEADAAWISAAALAIGRGQALVWIDPPRGSLARNLKPEEADAIDGAIRERLETLGLAWRDLGDTIDGVTLCLNISARLAAPDERGPRALTDRLGRHENGQRWAWAGQVLGDAPESLYRAACALFLHDPQRAWFFDGYQDEAPYNRYTVVGAAALMQEAGAQVTVDRTDAGSLGQWLRRGATAIDAGFIHVNTAGHRRWFNLNPGRATGRDVPMLARPAAVHFIHSFSAQDPGDAASIAATWLDRGAFCYLGAMDEPFLGAFLPPEILMQRLYSAIPWGAATRPDDAPLWKVNVFGDPLYTLGPDLPRNGAAPAFPDGEAIADRLRAALSERNIDEAARDLALLGRDADLLRLAQATLADESATVGPDLADAALHAAARAGARELVVMLFDRLAPHRQQDDRVREIVWLALRPALTGSPDVDTIAVLQRCAGGESLARDAEQLGRAMARSIGAKEGAAYLRAVAATIDDARERDRLEAAAAELGR